MTFGEKLKNARKEAGLIQEQLAEKINVSRSAIAKWETDKGTPDIDNVKVISELLNVSIDYLLDESESITFNETKEPINVNDYEKTGTCRGRYDAVCVAKHKDADSIIPLMRRRKLSPLAWIVETFINPEIFIIGDYLHTGLIGSYLVEKGDRQYLVTVSKDFITTKELATKNADKKFIIGNYRDQRMTYTLI